jgi:hypothetical protein
MARSRNPFWSLVVVALLLPVAVVTVPAGAATTNLLANPGFESGLGGHPWMASGWDTSRAGLETVFFGRDEHSARTGRYGVSVASASSILPMAHHWGQTLRITPDQWGKDLVFSVWTRNNGVEGRGYVLVQAYRDTIGRMAMEWKVDRVEAAKRLPPQLRDDNPATDLGWKRITFTEEETDWVERRARVHLPPSTNLVYVRLGLIGSGQVLFDDASLALEAAAPAPEPAPNVNLLEDPGFEAEATPWEYSLPPYPGMRAVRDTAVSHSGRVSIRFTGEGGIMTGRAGAAQVVCNRALSGKRLKLTGYLKCDSLPSAAMLKIFAHTARGTAEEISTGTVFNTMDWTPIEVEMNTPPDTYAVWAWMMYTAPVPGVLWFDDARLEVLGPATGPPTLHKLVR